MITKTIPSAIQEQAVDQLQLECIQLSKKTTGNFEVCIHLYKSLKPKMHCNKCNLTKKLVLQVPASDTIASFHQGMLLSFTGMERLWQGS